MNQPTSGWAGAVPTGQPAVPLSNRPAAIRRERLLDKYLARAVSQGASDLHIQGGQPAWYSINGETIPDPGFASPLTGEEVTNMLLEAVDDRGNLWSRFTSKKRLDFSYTLGAYRFRGHYGYAGRTPYGVFRLLSNSIPDFESLGLPQSILDLTKLTSGLIIFAGVTGSGKSTSGAVLENRIITEQHRKMITIEEPIEYMHISNKSLVIQREVGEDVESFLIGIEDAMREAPDIIKVGEMRDPETMQAAIRAATTGHLVFATIHAESARDVPTRILDAMPGDKLNDVRAQLSRSLKAVVYQRLLPSRGGGRRVLGYEIMHMSDQIANHIRENQLSNIDNELTIRDTGNVLFEQCLANLVSDGEITSQTAKNFAIRPKALNRYMSS